MNDAEQRLVRTFIQRSRRPRWLSQLASPTRGAFLSRHLDHCRDLDARFATALGRTDDAGSELRRLGAPDRCAVISADPELDGRELPLDEVLLALRNGARGTLVDCVPGRLAYFHDELGTHRRLVLKVAP